MTEVEEVLPQQLAFKLGWLVDGEVAEEDVTLTLHAGGWDEPTLHDLKTLICEALEDFFEASCRPADEGLGLQESCSEEALTEAQALAVKELVEHELASRKARNDPKALETPDGQPLEEYWTEYYTEKVRSEA